MENAIDWSTWIIAASAFITAVATGVLAYITRRYVLLTREYVTLTQEMLENSYRPEVVVFLFYEGVRAFQVTSTEYRSVTEIRIGVKNIGPGVARKIQFEMDPSFRPYQEGGSSLGDVYFLVNGVNRLVPAEEIKPDNIFLVGGFDDQNQVQTTIRGTWEDSKGKKYCEDFQLNFADPDLPQG